MDKKWRLILPLFLFLFLVLAACRAGSAPTSTAIPSTSTPVSHLAETPPPALSPTPATAQPIVAFPDFVAVVEKVRPTVASLQVQYSEQDIFGRTLTSTKSGSGVILDTDGHILTNNHVIEGALSIDVSLPDGRSFPGQLVGADPLSDLAVVKIEGQDLPWISFAPSPPRVGEWVVAVGNALALKGGPTVTQGIVSALGRSINIDGTDYYDLIQTSAAINPGNSGGPLVNLNGEVVGINSAKASAENIGYAISISTAQPVFQELVANKKVAWPYLGVSVGDVTPASAAQSKLPVEWGAILSEAMSGFPAYAAGLRANDIVVAFQGQEVKDATQFIVLLRRYRAGDKAEIVYYRGQERRTVTLTLAPRPDNP